MNEETQPAGAYVLVYGTLRNPQRVAGVIGGAYPTAPDVPARRAYLPGDRREEHHFFYAIKTDNPRDRIDGHLIGPFTPTQLERLDGYEGVRSGYYSRAEVEAIETEPTPGTPWTCWVYLGEGIKADHEAMKARSS